ncbi:Rad21 protein, partial [Coprinopsis sp. MPI-PUGE-AT-0042]
MTSTNMFYSEAILSRRGPLGRVWLAAHMERKLSKSQTLQTDIEQSVEAIMGQEVKIMALRLSGQLLLGVVRIYSRKAKYLLDDCNDALLKIKMAFRPGLVDLTEDQLNINKTSITLQANTVDLDLLLPDVNWDMDFIERPLRDYGQHQAQVEDITLPQGTGLDFATQDPFDVGPSDGIGSQDFLDVDLGIDWDDVPQRANDDAMSVDESVGVGRDAASARSLIEFPQLNGISKGVDLDMHSIRSLSRDPSEQPFQPTMEMDFPDFGGMDLGDLGIGFDEPVGEVPKEVSSRASSPLTDVPDTPAPVDENQLPEIPLEQPKAARKPREKKQIIDSVTELYDSAQAGPMKDVSNIVTEQRYLPRSSLAMRLLQIREDPLAHFLATKSTPNGAMFSAGPPGLAPELAELFLRPVETGTEKRRYVSVKEDGSKRIRLEEEEEEVEAGRRAMSAVPSIAGMSDRLGADPNATGDFEFADQTGPLDDYQLELPNEEAEIELPKARSVSAVPSIRSRLSTPAGDGWMEGEESYADATCPIAMFDSRQTQTQEEQEAETQEIPEEKGYSKNTVKALGFIRKELQTASEADMGDASMSFNAMATKASRRAASSFFFELLVLGTRDCVKVEQGGPFEDIAISAKPKLWQAQKHGRQASESI